MTSAFLDIIGEQTPASVLKSNPILRDITNSANPQRVNNAFPSSTVNASLALTAKRPRDTASRPVVESKLRYAEPSNSPPAPSTIEELLKLSDDQLPDIEVIPDKPAIEADEFSDLPVIDINIADTSRIIAVDEEQLKEGERLVELAEKERRVLQEKLTETLRNLVIDPKDFEWAYQPIVEYDERDFPPCLMFDDLPETVDNIDCY